MAAGSTYTPIATTTLGSSATSYTFSSIPSTYTDLVLVIQTQWTTSGNSDCGLRFNGDTGSNYSRTYVEGNGTSATSGRGSNENIMYITGYFSNTISTQIFQIMNYANTTTYKTAINRESSNPSDSNVGAKVGLWRSTAAINSVTIIGASKTFAAGSTFTIYGIAAA
jgi:hypothetical protein